MRRQSSLHSRLFEAEDAGHAARRRQCRGLHGLPATSDDLEACLEFQCPGEHQRGVLAQTQPGRSLGRGDEIRIAGLQAFEGRQAGHEDRRLAHVGRPERLGRTLDAQAPQVDPEQLAGPVE